MKVVVLTQSTSGRGLCRSLEMPPTESTAGGPEDRGVGRCLCDPPPGAQRRLLLSPFHPRSFPRIRNHHQNLPIRKVFSGDN